MNHKRSYLSILLYVLAFIFAVITVIVIASAPAFGQETDVPGGMVKVLPISHSSLSGFA